MYSSNAFFASGVSFVGMWHCVIITRLPRAFFPRIGKPFPGMIISLPTAQPDGTLIVSFEPSIDSISIWQPSTSCGYVRVSFVTKSESRRVNVACGVMCTLTNKSPGRPPNTPASPFSASLS